MATLADLVTDTKNLLYGMAQVERPKVDTLVTSGVVAGTTEIEWANPSLWKKDDYAESEDDGEIIELTEDHPAATNTATVIRGRRGTTAVAHAVGDVFLRNPEHPRHLIETMINQVIDNELWPHVWSRNEREVTGGFLTGKTTYDLAADDVDVEQVYQYDVAGDFKFSPIPFGHWDVVGSVNTNVASTGRLLRLYRVHDVDEPVYYTVRTRPSSAAVTSLSDQLVNMVPWGAVSKLLQGSIGGKLGAPSRSPQAVTQSGDRRLRDATFFRAEFERMRGDEKLRLQLDLMKEKRFKALRSRVG